MIHGVHHVAVSTTDIDRFVALYQRLFGFEIIARSGWKRGNADIDRMVQMAGSESRQVMLQLDRFYLEVFQYLEPKGVRTERRLCDPGFTHVCFYVDDIQAEYERLLALGMEFHGFPKDYGSMIAVYGRDCDGNVIELLQVTSTVHPCPYLGTKAST